MTKQRIIIVGAGPIGLHAGLRAVQDGFDVTVLERDDVGSAVMNWSHVRLFTPFSMNSTESGRRAISHATLLPAPDEMLTGQVYTERYLRPLAGGDSLAGRIQTSTELIAASRTNSTKSRWIGRPERAASAFRLLVRRSADHEETLECDLLLDCTGLTSRHRFIGDGGIPCPGEAGHLRDDDYRIASSAQSSEHVVVVGSGYSAATSVCELHKSASRVTWITHGDRTSPVEPISGDSLPERAALTVQANRLVLDNDSRVRWLPGMLVDAIDRTRSGLSLTLSNVLGHQQQLPCDRIVANPGFRPDTRPFEELQIHRCYATEGPMKMAAHLLGETSADCLSQLAPGADLLRNPEPGFFILGAASYGRDSRFLLKNGLEQIEQLFDSLMPVTESAS